MGSIVWFRAGFGGSDDFEVYSVKGKEPVGEEVDGFVAKGGFLEHGCCFFRIVQLL